MGEAAMDQNQLEEIGRFVKEHITEWMIDKKIYPFPQSENRRDQDHLERMIRVEEGIKAQNGKFESVDKQLDSVEKRFDGIDQRFDAIDTRLDRMDERFDAIDARLDGVDQRFDAIDTRLDGMDQRFDAIDTRLDTVENSLVSMDKRIDSLDIRFGSMDQRLCDMREDSEKRFNRLFVFLSGIFLTLLGGIITMVLSFL